MTTVQHNEYMDNVKWKTALYFGIWCASVLLAIAGMYYGLRGDIRQSNSDFTLAITKTGNYLNHKIDSSNYANQLQFQAIKEDISNMRPSVSAYYNQRKVNGKIILVPAK